MNAQDQPATADNARSLPLARKGIANSHQFAQLMSSLMSDLIEGRINPGVGNAVCNAGGKLLKMIELEQRFGTPGTSGGKSLQLTQGEDTPA